MTRENSVPCAVCRRPTWQDDALCERSACRSRSKFAAGFLSVAAAQGGHGFPPAVASRPLSLPLLDDETRGGSPAGAALPAPFPAAKWSSHGTAAAPGSGSSMTRRGLRALAAVTQRVAGSGDSPAPMSGMSRPGHHH